MARPLVRILTGFLAVLATLTLLCLQLVAAAHVDDASLRPLTAAAASLQTIVLIGLLWLAALHRCQHRSTSSTSRAPLAVLVTQLLGCALAAALSAVALARLSTPAPDATATSLPEHRGGLLAASSVALVLATPSQLALMLLHFVSTREHSADETEAKGAAAQGQRWPLSRTQSASASALGAKAIRPIVAIERSTPEKATQPPSGSKSRLFSPPFARMVHLSSSKTKLLAAGERRPSIRDSTRGSSSLEETFDSWDTSSVDTHNRQVVLNTSSSSSVKQCGLETIPASPRASRCQSPRAASDLEPPRSVRTRRSYSPGMLRHREEARLTASSSIDELHIHPLFRSDSQTPAPLASPGTSVVAAPNAGQVISRRESMQSLARMRSGSLRSPLSHQPSLESTKLRIQTDGAQLAAEQPELDCGAGLQPGLIGSAGDERRMTPPVPAWLLSPGAEASSPTEPKRAV